MERITKYRGHIKKLLLSTILLLLWNGGVNAQTSDASLYIKYNISYSIATYWNQSFGLEIPIKNKISLQAMFALGTPLLTLDYHPKQSFCFRMTPELRYYVAKKNDSKNLKGFYTGVFAYYQYQLLSAKPYSEYDYTNNIQVNKDKATWNYHYLGGGVSVGYQFQLLPSKKLLLDINSGIQYSYITYHTNAVDYGDSEKNFTYSRFLSSIDKNFIDNKISLIDPRVWICIGYRIK